jgi:hypothetical protein
MPGLAKPLLTLYGTSIGISILPLESHFIRNNTKINEIV